MGATHASMGRMAVGRYKTGAKHVDTGIVVDVDLVLGRSALHYKLPSPGMAYWPSHTGCMAVAAGVFIYTHIKRGNVY